MLPRFFIGLLSGDLLLLLVPLELSFGTKRALWFVYDSLTFIRVESLAADEIIKLFSFTTLTVSM